MNLTEEQKIDFIKKAAFIADKSICGYKVGCVGVVKDNWQKIYTEAEKDPQYRRKDGFIYLKTWNEMLSGEIYCTTCDVESKSRNCVRVQEELKGRDFQKVCSIHAEQNLIAKCARYTIPTDGMALFITNSPCYICAKSIVQAGIKEVYYLDEHTEKDGISLLSLNKILTEKCGF